MQALSVLIMIFMSTLALGNWEPASTVPVQADGWALGIGFGTESAYKSNTSVDVKTPRLFAWGPANVALVLNIEDKEVAMLEKSVLPVHLLFDFSYAPYKDIVKTYFRLGAGSILVDDKKIHSETSIFNVQFQLGFEVIAVRSPTGAYGVGFVQAMVNAAGIRTPPIGTPDLFGGTTTIVGFRTYF